MNKIHITLKVTMGSLAILGFIIPCGGQHFFSKIDMSNRSRSTPHGSATDWGAVEAGVGQEGAPVPVPSVTAGHGPQLELLVSRSVR